MLGLLRLPPLPSLVILLTVMALIVFAIVSAGGVQPWQIIILLVLGFAIIRILWRLWKSGRERRNEQA